MKTLVLLSQSQFDVKSSTGVVKYLVRRQGWTVWTYPTQSLARDIFRAFKKEFRHVFLKLSGHDDSTIFLPSDAVLIMTYESLAIALRNRVSWSDRACRVVIDEFHHIISGRGETIEELVADNQKRVLLYPSGICMEWVSGKGTVSWRAILLQGHTTSLACVESGLYWTPPKVDKGNL